MGDSIVMLSAFLILGLGTRGNSILLERPPSIQSNLPFRAFAHGEASSGDHRKPVYWLSAITVPIGGWRLDAATVFAIPNEAKWDRLMRARLNVIRKEGSSPPATFDPRKGKMVAALARVVGRAVEVRAKSLDVRLQPGEYWIGLTPIYEGAGSLTPRGLACPQVYMERFADVGRAPLGSHDAGLPAEGGWKAMDQRSYLPADRMAIRLEGEPIARGKRTLAVGASTDSGLLRLRQGTFDPKASPPVAASLRMPPEGRLWIAQFAKVVDESARETVRRSGFQVRAYLPDDAYVVLGASPQVVKLRRSAGVRCVIPYHPAYRIDPNTLPERLSMHLDGEDYRGPVDEPRGVRNVTVLLFNRDATAKARVAKRILKLGGQVTASDPESLYVAATLTPAAVVQVASMDDVCAVERRFTETRQQLKGERSDGVALTLDDVRKAGGFESLISRYQGLGVNVGIIDDGIREDHLDFAARPIRFVGPHDPTRSTNHGTPVSGIISGEGRSDPTSRGLAPLSRILFAHGERLGRQHGRYKLMRQFVSARACLISESAQFWAGEPFISHYEGGAQMLDDLVETHDVLICQAMGNLSPGRGTGGSWAKNALMVGGVEPHGKLDVEAHRPIWTRGPVPEGRIKPDLVHFGNKVLAPSSAAVDANGLFGGTSCATPLVAGHVALAMEMWANNAFGNWSSGGDVFARRPHAATLKALVINSAFAYPLGPHFTRDDQGWGRPHLGNLYNIRDRLFAANEDVLLRDREVYEYNLAVRSGESRLRATLVYTDPPGATSAARALVNDLDLVLIAPDGTRYLGNYGLLDGNVSMAGGIPDRLNNVENVFLESPQTGMWRIIVSAHRIAMPSREGGQRFGLVVSGVQEEA